jgi:hypothetical protein
MTGKPMPGWWKVALLISGMAAAVTGLKRLKDSGIIKDPEPSEPKPDEEKAP